MRQWLWQLLRSRGDAAAGRIYWRAGCWEGRPCGRSAACPPAALPYRLIPYNHTPRCLQVVAAVLKSMLEEGRAAGLKGFEQVRPGAKVLLVAMAVPKQHVWGLGGSCTLEASHA